ncbi:mitogen-activated protein kinase kinase 2 [Rhizoctonia solani]|uniref:Mitogen-activated protein kinase kinase 2 n=1 Tax=Rhizoctonia solani TaxID=456999 RepID=A0A0K6FS41_9AGAM|nr:mitogen-activated protein kinase kinase 2 [Rhizoctonia solani]
MSAIPSTEPPASPEVEKKALAGAPKKKRNIKALQLNVEPASAPAPAPPPIQLAGRSAKAPGAKPTAKRKPPKMDLTKSKGGAPDEEAGKKGASPALLTVDAPASAPTAASRNRTSYHSKLSQQLANLDVGPDRLDLKLEDLEELRELGAGNGGTVKLVKHLPTQTTMAKKVVFIDAKPAVRKQILRELQIMHDCHSEHIISFHGAFVADPHIHICMEYMDKGSLDGIYKKHGPIDIQVVGKIAIAVLEGLTYLYDVHRIIHRDIKPSNILFNSKGEIKICDFGVSGELINSIADTFVGTSTYMSPERIQGAQYTVKSDVWSLGISLIELALGHFPFAESSSDDSDLSDLAELDEGMSNSNPVDLSTLPSSRIKKPKKPATKKDKRKSKGVSLQGGGMTMSILELLQHIVNEPAPRLQPESKYPPLAVEFVDQCLLKDPEVRPTPKELLNHQWIADSRANSIDLVIWASIV